MEVILPFGLHDREQFLKCAIDIKYDEFAALKFNFTNQDSDIDVYEIMGDERIQQLLYGWELCNMQLLNIGEDVPENVQHIIKVLAHHTLKIWFSQEWAHCHWTLRRALVVYLDQARYIFAKIKEFTTLDWDYLLGFEMQPWSVPYLQNLFKNLKLNIKEHTENIEFVEQKASVEDVTYLQKEGLLIALLRLTKLMDAGSFEAVKQLSMRIIAAWNHEYTQGKTTVKKDEKHCLILISHIYLMAVYATDDNTGNIIDNMMHNIRFYHQSMLESKHQIFNDDMQFTTARLIALTCVRLSLNENEFFELFIFNTYDDCFTTIFGVISQAYMSYLLGNLLMEMTALNEEDFNRNIAYFKRIMKNYVHERERSEIYLLEVANKQNAQSCSHNPPDTVDMHLNYKIHICKGNRMSNIGNYKNNDDNVEQQTEQTLAKEKCSRRFDPIFQNIPNNEEILYYIYAVLAKRSYNGWHFAKVVLLLKIIGHKLKKLETWRYHPGLTTDFMLNLEMKLAEYYADLAHIFQDHHFMEQEFWLTAFYLYPNRKYYHELKRCGLRFHRRRLKVNNGIDDEQSQITRPDKIDAAQFGLLSSTIDVGEIVNMTNHETPQVDYQPLRKSLHEFRLPESIIKDLLTVTFQPRNRSFSWALNWLDLRQRCKNLFNTAVKRRFVELNMAEANDRLKFLNIDYEKYKNRPQLDYGTIEEGYENITNMGDNMPDSDDDDFGEDEKSPSNRVRKKARVARKRHFFYTSDDDEKDESSDESSSYYTGTRRTRARKAAVVATTMFKDVVARRTDKSKDDNDDALQAAAKAAAEAAAEPKVPEPIVVASIDKRPLEDLLEECISYNNATSGFKPFHDVWTLETQDVQTDEDTANKLLKTTGMLSKFSTLRGKKGKLDTGLKAIQQEEARKKKLQEEEEMERKRLEKLKISEQASQVNGHDSDSMHSDTSMTAMKDMHEDDGKSIDATMCEYNDATPLDTSVHMSRKTEEEQDEEIFKALIEVNEELLENGETDIVGQHIITLESGMNKNQAENGYTPLELQMMKECRENNATVLLHRLTVSDVTNLRQPSVRLERTDFEAYFNERQQHSKVDSSTEDNSGSSSSTNIMATQTKQPYMLTQIRKRKFYQSIPTPTARRIAATAAVATTSESSNDGSYDVYKPKRSVGSRAVRGRRNWRNQRASNLIVTPRSASGLKLRISNLEHDKPNSPEIDFIQLSSSSSAASTPTLDSPLIENVTCLSPTIEENHMMFDPLYEEEVVPYR